MQELVILISFNGVKLRILHSAFDTAASMYVIAFCMFTRIYLYEWLKQSFINKQFKNRS